MKWPNTLTIVRHGQSAYNELRAVKNVDPLYQMFREAYEKKDEDPETAKALAEELVKDGRFTLNAGDHDTALTKLGGEQAEATGRRLSELIDVPDFILVSPYERTHHTLARMAIGWTVLSEIKTIEEERLREQEHGLTLLYNDWRIFSVLHPDQAALWKTQGPYWYRFPQGENVPDVRERWRSLLGTITRDYCEKNILIVGHHLSILALRANLERLNAKEFLDLDTHHKPVNCGVTVYRGNPEVGEDGRLELDIYNRQLY